MQTMKKRLIFSRLNFLFERINYNFLTILFALDDNIVKIYHFHLVCEFVVGPDVKC